MASQKLSQLSTITDVQNGDLYYVVRGPNQFAITGASLLAAFGGAAAQGIPANVAVDPNGSGLENVTAVGLSNGETFTFDPEFGWKSSERLAATTNVRAPEFQVSTLSGASVITSLATTVRNVALPDSDGTICFLAPSSTFAAPASGGNAAVSVSDYSAPNFSGGDTVDISAVLALASQMAAVTAKIQAIETAFLAGNYPSAAP